MLCTRTSAVVEVLACAVQYGSTLSRVAGAAEELNFQFNLI